MSKRTGGFTLIELLVVIGIIGILASIVLLSLNAARQKGRDASASGSISSIRNQVEIYLNDNNDYTGVLTDPAIIKLITAAETQTGNPSSEGASAISYYVAIPLVGDSTRDFCIDSTGFAGKVATGTEDVVNFACN